jgi:hypothetical protein
MRQAATTAMSMDAVCSAPTCVRNEAISTVANGAAATDPRGGGEQAGERQSQS